MPESRLPAASTPAAEVAAILAQCAPSIPGKVLHWQSPPAKVLLPLAQKAASAFCCVKQDMPASSMPPWGMGSPAGVSKVPSSVTVPSTVRRYS